MRVPDDVRKTVVFIGRVNPPGASERLTLVGTAFLVAIASSAPNRHHVYLVTAKHLAEPLAAGQWGVRFNDTQGRCVESFSDNGVPWSFHPTESGSVDIAVARIEEMTGADVKTIPEEMFLNDKLIQDRGIGAGDDVFIAGLFGLVPGKYRNLPIIRMGNIALIPDSGELIPGIRIGGPNAPAVAAEAYLIEGRSIGGLSGSPAFVRETYSVPLENGAHGQLAGHYSLMGLVHGHWDVDIKDLNEPKPMTLQRSDRRYKEDAVNLGIAIVVPSQKLREVLYQPALVEQRREIDQDYMESVAANPD